MFHRENKTPTEYGSFGATEDHVVMCAITITTANTPIMPKAAVEMLPTHYIFYILLHSPVDGWVGELRRARGWGV